MLVTLIVRFLIDLNYSDSNGQGTGTSVLIDESIEGVNIVCSGVECSYIWDVSALPDGNYNVLLLAKDGLYSTFDSTDSTFEMTTTPVIPPTQDTNSTYTEQFTNASSGRRDGNIYYSSGSLRNLTEEQKQTLALQQTQNLLFFGGFILLALIIIGGVVLYKRKR